MTTDDFTPPAAAGLPAGTLEAAEIGANRLDAWARSPQGRNFLAHALVQLARTGWLRTEPGAGFEPTPAQEPAEPAAGSAVVAPPTDHTTPSHRAGLRDEIVNALGRITTTPPVAHRRAQADHILAVLYREWPWLRAEAEDAAPTDRAAAEAALAAVETALCDTLLPDAREEALARLMTVLPPTIDRAAVLREAANGFDRHAAHLLDGIDELAVFVAKARQDQAAVWGEAAETLRRMADETATETPEDPARIDRLRPEFTEHASVEAIDAQLDRARRQERRWHLRAEWLIGLRQARAEEPAAGARQDGAQP